MDTRVGLPDARKRMCMNSPPPPPPPPPPPLAAIADFQCIRRSNVNGLEVVGRALHSFQRIRPGMDVGSSYDRL